MKSVTFHKRNLPHLYIPESTYFITFRVKDSIPLNKLLKLNQKFEKLRYKPKSDIPAINENYFCEYDALIHKFDLARYLDNAELVKFIKTELHKSDGRDYKLICYSIMPNHVHLIFHLLENSRTVDKIMQSIKRLSAYYINLYLGRKGSFWQSESYDHIVRNTDGLYKLIEYTLMNPVKEGIVEDWRDYPNNYLSDDW